MASEKEQISSISNRELTNTDSHQVHPDKMHEGVTLREAGLVEPVSLLSMKMGKLWVICLFMFLGATILGYDASLMGTMIALPSFQAQFDATIIGAKAGLISSMFAIGSVCALPFVGPAADTWGRRYGMAIGCVSIIMGTIIQGTAHQLSQYMGGRFFVGFGSGFAGITAAYIAEIAHPTHRGTLAGLYNCLYYFGSFLASVVLRACLEYQTSGKSWQIPTWFQAAMPGILLIACFFVPESPRWLYAHGKPEECRQILAKYHGFGNAESIYVGLQMREIEDQLVLEGADKRWWDYRCLFNSKKNLYRVLMCAVAVPAFAQWTGQGVGYFLPGVLATMGVTSVEDVMDINIGMAVASGIAAVIGASFMDRAGRRKMLISCCICLALTWVGLTVATERFSINPHNTNAAKAAIVFIFLVTVVFSVAYTPLQQLYPVEILSYEQRGKGIAFASMGGNAAALVNLFATPIALEKIGWRTYGIWIATCTLQAIYYYFFMVETKGHTLEEMDAIFAAKNPRDASLQAPSDSLSNPHTTERSKEAGDC